MTTGPAESPSSPGPRARDDAPPTAINESDGAICPLCTYNLRGLAEARCPECGYRFEWPDVLDPERRRHPYLFEQNPHRNIRSFVQTLLGGLLPRRFWRLLRPSQPSDLRRLLLYWTLATCLAFAWPLGLTLRLFRADAASSEQYREFLLRSILRHLQTEKGLSLKMLQQEVAQRGGPQGWVDDRSPPTLSKRFLKCWWFGRDDSQQFNQIARAPAVYQMLHVPLLYAAWPWTTLAVLTIFRASMRRARIKSIHMLRCALYSCDAGVVFVPLASTVAGLGYVFVPALGGTGVDSRLLIPIAIAACTAYRLAAAQAFYTRFDRPVATALATQLIVLLAVVAALPWVAPLEN